MERNNDIYGAISRRKFLAAAMLAVKAPQNNPQTRIPTDQVGSSMSKLSKFISNSRYDTIPPRALAEAKTAIMDCLGVAIAGGKEESARISGMLAREERAKEETTIYGQRFKSSALQAAFVNGTAAHAHDFDHSFVVGGQPTSPIIPAVFALGETLGASGKQ